MAIVERLKKTIAANPKHDADQNRNNLGDFFADLLSDVSVPVSPDDLKGQGKILAFLPIYPGSGATTLAIYAALASLGKKDETKEIALTDLTPWGKARSYLGLHPDDYPTSVLDLIRSEDGNDAARFGILHPFGFFVFPGVVHRLDAVLDLMPEPLAAVKAATHLKSSFDAGILILPPVESGGWSGAMIADRIFLIVPPTRVAVDAYPDVLSILERFGARDRTRVILNLTGMPGTMDQRDVVSLFRPDTILPYDAKVEEAINQRRPDYARRFYARFQKGLMPLLRL